MKCVEELIRNFVDNLKREGFQVPTEIVFPKKTYDRIATEAYRKAYYGMEWPASVQELVMYLQDAKIVIKKHICKECGQ